MGATGTGARCVRAFATSDSAAGSRRGELSGGEGGWRTALRSATCEGSKNPGLTLVRKARAGCEMWPWVRSVGACVFPGPDARDLGSLEAGGERGRAGLVLADD